MFIYGLYRKNPKLNQLTEDINEIENKIIVRDNDQDPEATFLASEKNTRIVEAMETAYARLNDIQKLIFHMK